MFAKRQSALAAAAGAAPRVRDGAGLKPVVDALRKPPVAAGLAGLLLLGASALFLTVILGLVVYMTRAERRRSVLDAARLV